MKKGKDIAAEWEQIAPGLHLPGEAPFGVPEGYFAALPAQVMQRIRNTEDAPVAAILDALPKAQPLSAPGTAYFSQLGNQVMQRIHLEEAGAAREEAREIDGILAGLPKALPFTATPPTYFNTLSSQVMQRIQLENAEAAQDAPETASILAGLPGELPFTPAPPAYFDTLAGQVMDRIRQQETVAKVVPLKARRPWIKWAAAACTIGVLATSGALFLRRHGNALDGQLSKVSDQELVDYLQTHTDDFDNDAIFASVSNTPALAPDQEKTQSTLQLEDIPTEDLDQYIESTKTNDL